MTAWLVAVLGSERVADRTAQVDHSLRPLFRSLTGLPMWSGDRIAGGLEWALAAKLATLLVGVALLAWLASSSAGSRMTAFLAGWAASVVSSAMAGLTYAAVGNLVHAESDTGLVGTVTEVNRGAVFGLYTGWLVGLAIAAVIVPVASPATGSAERTSGLNRPSKPQPPNQQRTGSRNQPQPAPVATWPPRPPMGTVLPNPAWTAAGLREETRRPQPNPR
jgi:hypothetical protein